MKKRICEPKECYINIVNWLMTGGVMINEDYPDETWDVNFGSVQIAEAIMSGDNKGILDIIPQIEVVGENINSDRTLFIINKLIKQMIHQAPKYFSFEVGRKVYILIDYSKDNTA